jgi:hypothetical protein
LIAMTTPDQAHSLIAARAAGVILVALGAGFGLGAAWATLHLRQNGELPLTPWGFRAMAGPAEQLGTDAFSVLGFALAAISALNVLAGGWLWRGERRGLRLSQATFVPTMLLGVGFALPFLLIGLPIAAVLGFLGRGSLRSRSEPPV